jgi:hypothetical protein
MERELGIVTRAKRSEAKVIHLISQADRARKLAAGCGSSLIAELFILHAQLCEENARKTPPSRLHGRRKPILV